MSTIPRPRLGQAPTTGLTVEGSVLELVERARAGDGEAFGHIYEQYLPIVSRYVYRRVDNHALAEDLTAETFLRALKHLDTFAWQGRDIGAWLVTIARNLAADYFKSSRYRREISTIETLEDNWEEHSPEGNPEQMVTKYLTNVDLMGAVICLNDEQYECVVRRFLLDLSVTETAHIMNKTVGAVKALQYRATQSVKRHLPEGFKPA